jgi:hypothetical protein
MVLGQGKPLHRSLYGSNCFAGFGRYRYDACAPALRQGRRRVAMCQLCQHVVGRPNVGSSALATHISSLLRDNSPPHRNCNAMHRSTLLVLQLQYLKVLAKETAITRCWDSHRWLRHVLCIMPNYATPYCTAACGCISQRYTHLQHNTHAHTHTHTHTPQLLPRCMNRSIREKLGTGCLSGAICCLLSLLQ